MVRREYDEDHGRPSFQGKTSGRHRVLRTHGKLPVGRGASGGMEVGGADGRGDLRSVGLMITDR